jgi:hypothetical protein
MIFSPCIKHKPIPFTKKLSRLPPFTTLEQTSVYGSDLKPGWQSPSPIGKHLTTRITVIELKPLRNVGILEQK